MNSITPLDLLAVGTFFFRDILVIQAAFASFFVLLGTITGVSNKKMANMWMSALAAWVFGAIGLVAPLLSDSDLITQSFLFGWDAQTVGLMLISATLMMFISTWIRN